MKIVEFCTKFAWKFLGMKSKSEVTRTLGIFSLLEGTTSEGSGVARCRCLWWRIRLLEKRSFILFCVLT